MQRRTANLLHRPTDPGVHQRRRSRVRRLHSGYRSQTHQARVHAGVPMGVPSAAAACCCLLRGERTPRRGNGGVVPLAPADRPGCGTACNRTGGNVQQRERDPPRAMTGASCGLLGTTPLTAAPPPRSFPLMRFHHSWSWSTFGMRGSCTGCGTA
jgi:hypothetical protein